MNNIAVIGLGYVGLPVALAIAKKFPHTVGFDINKEKTDTLFFKPDDTVCDVISELCKVCDVVKNG